VHVTARRALWAVLAVAVVTAIVVLVARSGPSSSPEARAQRLAHELACPVCAGESVAESNVPEARAMRAEIRDSIRDGQTDRQIRDTYVRAYGERVLLTPDNGGVGVIAWGLPIVVLLIGGAGIVLGLRRWSRTPKLTATADDEAIVARARTPKSGQAGLEA
jgi:cytochrome c-type biogenesis protein CcmH